MKELIVATRNVGKLKEIEKLCAEYGVSVHGLDKYPNLPEIIEDGNTFAENAAKKAETVAKITGCPCLADDSGLIVEALSGEPGVHSSRYAGEGADDSANNLKLLTALRDVPDSQRRAAFCCVMALCVPGEKLLFFDGRVDGLILRVPRGEGGFGYDPLFLIPELGLTMAQLPLTTKNRISHRGQALRKVMSALNDLLN